METIINQLQVDILIMPLYRQGWLLHPLLQYLEAILVLTCLHSMSLAVIKHPQHSHLHPPLPSSPPRHPHLVHMDLQPLEVQVT